MVRCINKDNINSVDTYPLHISMDYRARQILVKVFQRVSKPKQLGKRVYVFRTVECCTWNTPVTQDQYVSSAHNEVRFLDLSTPPPLTLYCRKSSQCQETDG